MSESQVPTTGGCPVKTGRWTSYFDNKVWTQASDVDIDHMVPLSEAWDSGAQHWTYSQRRAFANDLTWGPSLVAVTDNVNASKGDRDPAQWLPPSSSAICRYLGEWVTVKYRWNLTVDQAEHNAIASRLSSSCSGLKVTVPPDAGTPGSVFSDVSVSYTFYPHISWLAGEGITNGYNDGTYRPDSPVTRGQMAAFLYKLAGSPAYTPPTVPLFSDVPRDYLFYKHISWLAEEGITSGRPDGTFAPNTPVSRAAMAAFLYKLADEPAYTPPTTPVFPDVPKTYTFYQHISWLAQEGITNGYNDGTFKPVRSVTRGQMAAFLYKFDQRFVHGHRNLLVGGQLISVLAVT